jgi:phospholipase C
VSLPVPRDSGIEHIVVVMMENRSFDHLLGWLPGADGKQAGLLYRDTNGREHSTHPLAPDYTGCGHHDPEHGYEAGRVAYDGGAMDGFLRARDNDDFALGYYTAADLPFFAGLAQSYTVCDRYFTSILGPTFPNRMFQWAAQTDRLDNSISLSKQRTIFDRLSAARVSHRYYFSDLPFVALWGFRYVLSTSILSSFFDDVAAGKLPAVSFVDPFFTVLDDGTGGDAHPHSDVRNADAFLARIFNALAMGPKWRNTVLVINWDESGGFFDHVPPPRVVAANNVDQDQIDGTVLLGMRAPTLIVSPFTRNRTGAPPLVNSTVFDHTSVLKLIEWRWGLQPLTPRDASNDIGNLAVAMNFATPDPSLPLLPNADPVDSPLCLEGGILGPLTDNVPLAQNPYVRAFLSLLRP